MQVYSNSIGNIDAPYYPTWTNDIQNTENWIIIAMIWCVWVINQIFNLIIMLNFLIAVISNVYDTVNEKKELLMYTQRAQINREYFMLKNFFKISNFYNFIIFSFSKSDGEEDEDQDFGSLVDKIKEYTKE